LALACGLGSCDREQVLARAKGDAATVACDPPVALPCVDQLGPNLDSTTDMVVDIPTAAATDDWSFTDCAGEPGGTDSTVAFRVCETGAYGFFNPGPRSFPVGRYVVVGDRCDPTLTRNCDTGYVSPPASSSYVQFPANRGEQIMIVFEGVSPADEGELRLGVRRVAQGP